ncbi:unnamed protein product, partial [Strongylus vulgaris]
KDKIIKIKSQLEAKSIAVSFLHVSSDYNPADKGTRGLTASEINSSSWIQGPQWLNKEAHTWPIKHISWLEQDRQLDNCEITVQAVIAPVIAEREENANILIDLTHFSKLNRALRTLAFVAKLIINWAKATNKNRNTNISIALEDHFTNSHEIIAEDISASETLILAQEHKNFQVDELQKRFTNQKILRDGNGLIRYESRITNALLPYDTKFPIFLPNQSEATRLIITNIHEQNAHCGKEQTLSILRQRFWIPKPSITDVTLWDRSYLRQMRTCTSACSRALQQEPYT